MLIILKKLLIIQWENLINDWQWRVQDFQDGGANLLCGKITALKWKKLDQRGDTRPYNPDESASN